MEQSKTIKSKSFFFELLLVLTIHYCSGTTEVQYSHCHPPSSILNPASLPLFLDASDWSPQEPLVLVVTCVAELILL